MPTHERARDQRAQEDLSAEQCPEASNERLWTVRELAKDLPVFSDISPTTKDARDIRSVDPGSVCRRAP